MVKLGQPTESSTAIDGQIHHQPTLTAQLSGHDSAVRGIQWGSHHANVLASNSSSGARGLFTSMTRVLASCAWDRRVLRLSRVGLKSLVMAVIVAWGRVGVGVGVEVPSASVAGRLTMTVAPIRTVRTEGNRLTRYLRLVVVEWIRIQDSHIQISPMDGDRQPQLEVMGGSGKEKEEDTGNT
ncbi:hypothetical protein BD410DRAFT_810113 [Rickenella mellea]|uniref:Uncharacterized protein n=1 Tax=Rickenella mellea TaxID=50990 RepID=A0A4Y7PFC3_9AGAM|nr:hypothetical protein BD410DRAFT_810113 [Rickenella mellea]